MGVLVSIMNEVFTAAVRTLSGHATIFDGAQITDRSPAGRPISEAWPHDKAHRRSAARGSFDQRDNHGVDRSSDAVFGP